MSVHIWAHLWCPEGLAVRWRRLPERIGYTVLPLPSEYARQRWQREAAGERRRVAEGWYTKDRPIDDAVVDLVVAQQQAAFVVTEGVAFYISAYPDYLQQHDSNRSWWLEVKTATEREICAGYPDVCKDFRMDLYRRAALTLFDSFLASGARDAPNAMKNADALNLPPPSRNLITAWFFGRVAKRLFLCPMDLVTQWPEKLLDSTLHWEFSSLRASARLPMGERFTCGRMGNWFREIAIRTGPALDPVTWNDAGFLTIESKGILWRNTSIGQLTQRATEFGACPVG